MALVLASASPRRREILAVAGIEFTVRPANLDESTRDGESPEAHVLRLAEAKARAVWREGETVLGADTVVAVDDQLLGKPADDNDAARMLDLISGRRHRVLTGVCFYDGDQAHTGIEETFVEFDQLSDQEIADYVATGEPADKAGAYAIQGGASKFVRRIEGCYFNVVGLPVARVYEFMRSSLR
jgi:septum formation protein